MTTKTREQLHLELAQMMNALDRAKFMKDQQAIDLFTRDIKDLLKDLGWKE